MKVVFVSNYLSPHQTSLAAVFNAMKGVEYTYIATTPFNEKRYSMGYRDENEKYDFVLRTYESEKILNASFQIVNDADLVVVGSAPYRYISRRVDLGKVTFRATERYFKRGFGIKMLPRNFAAAMLHIRPYQNKPLYYLCASAYTAKDVNTFSSFPERCYKWGYFTKVNELDENDIAENRKINANPVILWVGRFVSWKHPDIAVRLAGRLKKHGYRFQLNFIGDGDLAPQLREMVQKDGLENQVHFLGFLSHELVRQQMELADVFISTSNFTEGWGAVIGEAMSSGCATVASHACGASPFLIDDSINGFMFRNGDEDQLFDRVAMLLDDVNLRNTVGIRAYKTMSQIWNSDVAAKRLIRLNEEIKDGNPMNLFESGPCSPAAILENDWYHSDISN